MAINRLIEIRLLSDGRFDVVVSNPEIGLQISSTLVSSFPLELLARCAREWDGLEWRVRVGFHPSNKPKAEPTIQSNASIIMGGLTKEAAATIAGETRAAEWVWASVWIAPERPLEPAGSWKVLGIRRESRIKDADVLAVLNARDRSWPCIVPAETVAAVLGPAGVHKDGPGGLYDVEATLEVLQNHGRVHKAYIRQGDELVEVGWILADERVRRRV